MAGFLTRIAARLDGSTAALRPRTPSLFEPEPTAAFAPEAVDIVAEEQQPASASAPENDGGAGAVVTPSVAAPTSSPKERRTDTPVPAALDRHADGQPAMAAASRGPRGQAQPGPMTAPPADPAERDAPAPKGEGVTSQQADIVAGPQGRRDDGAGRIGTIEQIDTRPAVVRRATALQASSLQPDTTTTPVGDRRDMAAAASPPISGANGILQAPVIARMPPAPLLSSPRARRSEPAVHVTIGRVEVRAVATSPAGNARPERRSPVMGLDEYLRTRAR
jgi:hypothetical protein